MKHAQRYLISYLQEYITKCVGSAIQMSLLFLGDVVSVSLAFVWCI